MDSKLLWELRVEKNPYRFIEEVGFSLVMGDGYPLCFPGFGEERDFQNKWGDMNRET